MADVKRKFTTDVNMRFLRMKALVAIAALLAAGLLVDVRERPLPWRSSSVLSAIANANSTNVSWFCPGASGSKGSVANFNLAIVSAASVDRSASVAIVTDPSSADWFAVSNTLTVDIPAGESVRLVPDEMMLARAQNVPDALWLGAIIEIDGADVVVEQVVTGRNGSVGRSSCLTSTAKKWIIPYGATRVESQGERLIVMLLNPFADFAVVEMDVSSDVGRDSVDGLVVPARSVVAVEVADEVNAAAQAMVTVETVSGRLAVSWIQTVGGIDSPQSVRIAAATAEPASVWYLPVAASDPGRRDLVAVANPSADETALVDITIIPNRPGTSVNPIELTVPPNSSVVVDLAERAQVEAFDSYTVVLSSPSRTPVAASMVTETVDSAVSVGGAVGSVVDSATVGTASETVDSAVGLGETSQSDNNIDSLANNVTSDDDHTLLADNTNQSDVVNVVGTSAITAANAAARHWLLPVHSNAIDESSMLVLVNPSSVGIALVDVVVVLGKGLQGGGQVVEQEIGQYRGAIEGQDSVTYSLELGAQRHTRLSLSRLLSSTQLDVLQAATGVPGYIRLDVRSSSPVIAATDLVERSQLWQSSQENLYRAASLGVAVSELVPLDQLD